MVESGLIFHEYERNEMRGWEAGPDSLSSELRLRSSWGPASCLNFLLQGCLPQERRLPPNNQAQQSCKFKTASAFGLFLSWPQGTYLRPLSRGLSFLYVGLQAQQLAGASGPRHLELPDPFSSPKLFKKDRD